jgi:hypothetical protein
LKYDDLLPLQAHVDQVLAAALVRPPSDVLRTPAVAEEVEVAAQDTASIRQALCSLGVADDVAHVLIREAKALHPSADPLLLMAAISERLATRPVKSRKPSVPKPPEPVPQDLRHIVTIGKQAGQSGYEALLAAGLIKPPLLDFAA